MQLHLVNTTGDVTVLIVDQLGRGYLYSTLAITKFHDLANDYHFDFISLIESKYRKIVHN